MSDVILRVAGVCGRITLNRPRAMNALTRTMVDAIGAALVAWAEDDGVQFVLVDGAGERGLCAGGDIRALYNAIVSHQPEVATNFFRREYRLNHLISRYPKPYIALMDGIVMGGGIGISSHGSHRLVTERSQLAMPETAIGFVPDVGSTYLLGIAPGEIGIYLGLTGSRIGAADALRCGLADSMVRSEDLQSLTEALERCADARAAEESLRSYAVEPPAGMTPDRVLWIDACFAGSSIESIAAALLAHSHEEAHAAAALLGTLSPTSLKLTLRALRSARQTRNLAASLRQEFRLAQMCARGHDLVEGIRAAIVDKDRHPSWSPARLEDVTPAIVDASFNDRTLETLDFT